MRLAQEHKTMSTLTLKPLQYDSMNNWELDSSGLQIGKFKTKKEARTKLRQEKMDGDKVVIMNQDNIVQESYTVGSKDSTQDGDYVVDRMLGL